MERRKRSVLFLRGRRPVGREGKGREGRKEKDGEQVVCVRRPSVFIE